MPRIVRNKKAHFPTLFNKTHPADHARREDARATNTGNTLRAAESIPAPRPPSAPPPAAVGRRVAVGVVAVVAVRGVRRGHGPVAPAAAVAARGPVRGGPDLVELLLRGAGELHHGCVAFYGDRGPRLKQDYLPPSGCVYLIRPPELRAPAVPPSS